MRLIAVLGGAAAVLALGLAALFGGFGGSGSPRITAPTNTTATTLTAPPSTSTTTPAYLIGPNGSTLPTSPRTTVPNVIGQSTAQAEAALTAADIDFTTQTQASQLPAGTVVAQAPEAGSYVPPKAVIVLKIAAS